MKFSELAAFDLKKIPTDVLQVMYKAFHDELSHRRACNAVSDRKLRETSHEEFMRIPAEKHLHNRHHMKYLDGLMSQDWRHLFQGGSQEKKFYVYAHVVPSKKLHTHDGEFKLNLPGIPFYIGKGCGNRAFDLKRNQGHGVELAQLLERGSAPSEIVHIIKDGMTEAEALEVESKLIYFFGTKFERHRRGLLVNLDIPPTPF